MYCAAAGNLGVKYFEGKPATGWRHERVESLVAR